MTDHEPKAEGQRLIEPEVDTIPVEGGSRAERVRIGVYVYLKPNRDWPDTAWWDPAFDWVHPDRSVRRLAVIFAMPGIRVDHGSTLHAMCARLQARLRALERRSRRWPDQVAQQARNAASEARLLLQRMTGFACRGGDGGDLQSGWPELDRLPAEIWALLDAWFEVAYALGWHDGAMAQASEVWAGHRVRSGGRKAAAERRVIDPEERIAAWREGLAEDAELGRPKHGRIQRVARNLAKRFGTSVKAEREFFNRRRAEILRANG